MNCIHYVPLGSHLSGQGALQRILNISTCGCTVSRLIQANTGTDTSFAAYMTPSISVSPRIIWMIASFHVTAIGCTAARVLYRWHMERFCWEDLWALIAAIWAVMSLTGIILRRSPISPVSTRNLVSNWFETLSFTMVVWAVRFSIFLSLVRVSNPTGSTRYIAFACEASLLIMCIASAAQKIYYCAAYNCFVSSPVAIMQLITDVLADAVLVFAPILFLRGVRLSKNRRILILSAFSSSILVAIMSIVQSAFLLYSLGNITLILSQIKVALSLFICNILVFVTFIYRVWRRGKGEGTDLYASFPFRQTLYLTPIDLNQLTAGSTLSTAGGYTNTNTNTNTNANSNMNTHMDSASWSGAEDASQMGTARSSSCAPAADTDTVDVERPRTQPDERDGHTIPPVVDASPQL